MKERVLIPDSLRRVLISELGMTVLFTGMFVAVFWLLGMRNIPGILISLAVGLPVGIYTARMTREASAYSFRYIESGKMPLLRRFRILYDSGGVPSNKTERQEYSAYLERHEVAAQRAVKQTPLAMVIMLASGVLSTSHGRISIFTIIAGLTFGALAYSYIQIRITLARIPKLKELIKSAPLRSKTTLQTEEKVGRVAQRQPLLYAFALIKASIVLVSSAIEKQPLFVPVSITTSHSSQLIWVLIYNALTIAYLGLPLYIVVSRSVNGVLRALVVLLSLLLIGLLTSVIQTDYLGILLESIQIGLAILLLVMLAKSAAR